MFDVPLEPAQHAELAADRAPAAAELLRTELQRHIPETPDVIAMATATRTTPLLSARLRVRAAGVRLDARAWIGDTLVALVERQAVDEAPAHTLVLGDVDAFPRLLAALIELGPRKRPKTPGFPFPPGGLALIGGVVAVEERHELSRPYFKMDAGADVEAVLHQDTRRWVLEVAPGAELVEPPTVFDVVDAPGHGLWLVQGDDDTGTTLVAVDPSIIWGMLSGLVDGALLLGLASGTIDSAGDADPGA